MRREDINIKEVAKRAGVSMATVSRVFNNSARVSEETRKKVEAVIAETHYRPNILARELIQKKTALVGLIVHDLVGEGIPRMVNGISEQLEKNGYQLLIATSKGSTEREQKHLDTFLSKRVDAILFSARQFNDKHAALLQELPVPVVVLLQDTKQAPLSCVSFDNYTLSHHAAKTLLSKGHRHFAFIGGPSQSLTSQERKSGFLSALDEANCLIKDEMLITTDYHIESGYKATRRLVEAHEPITAIITINDGLALGAMNALEERGLSIPRDVSLLSLDNTALADAARKQLAGIRFSYEDLGKEGAAMLVGLIEAEQTHIEKRKMPYLLDLAETVSPSIKNKDAKK